MKNNKEIVIDFYSKIIGKSNKELADILIKDDYIQHSPTIEDGKQGILKMIDMFASLPKSQNPDKPFYRFISDGEFVVAHIGISFMGQKRAVVDLFRLEDGKLAEHWDASEIIPSGIDNMVEGPVEIKEHESTNRNKKLVADFINKVLIGGTDEWDKYVHTNLIQHIPDVEDGNLAWKRFAASQKTEKCYRVLAEGNFVVSQCSTIGNNESCVAYNIYLVEDGLIAEHWSVKQKIPEAMAHDNGMI
ncbi:nuclear transport factor 2 family protein [Fulvivirga ligni]|uniref:nuclear transport factor 2 family protein n=1 Tax=Fulvivirga ligni TaxID=2904246 RepID=UPI001F300509|nr:hypothetical protein [Fulvivirga ligni]UII21501.1 hypothetical protein LVD16_27105 [Fulvivirga ligni]